MQSSLQNNPTDTEDTQQALLNMLDDYSAEKAILENTQRAVLNILGDYGEEKLYLEKTQSAVLNILDDFSDEKRKTETINEDLISVNKKFKNTVGQLKESEENLQKSLKKVSDYKYALDESAIVAITDQKGIIKQVNDNFCKISKYRREELIGQDHRIINSSYHPKEFIRDLWVTIANGKIWRGDLKNKAKDGTYYWVDTTIVPFLNEQGKPYQYTAIRADITDRKKSEEQLLAVNKELEAFSYSVSHDLRAPLRSLDGFSQALLEDYAKILDETGKDYLNRVRAASQRMGQLIDDMLNLARVTRAEMRREVVNLSQMARAVAAELRKTQPERRVEFYIAEGIVANGDARLLRVVMDNLLGNAWKYTGKHPTATIEFSMTQNDGRQIYFVRDDGAGFDMKYAEKLFGAFQRLHAMTDFSGTGIGLATVQRIIHRHGGRVWAESNVEQGTIFYFTLS